MIQAILNIIATGADKKGVAIQGKKHIGSNDKIASCITADFRIIEGFLTAGNKADIGFADELSADIYDCYIIEDKGYDSNNHRINLSANNNVPVIPGRSNRIEPIVYDKEKFKLRSKIENFFAGLKENRRLALRYEKSDLSFPAFVAIATIKYHLCSQCVIEKTLEQATPVFKLVVISEVQIVINEGIAVIQNSLDKTIYEINKVNTCAIE